MRKNQFTFSGKIKILLLAVLMYPAVSLHAQTTQEEPPPAPPEQTIDEEEFHQRIESLIEESDEEIDASELIEELEMLRQRPLNLNAASAEDLRRIFFLTDIQINNLILHRQRFGNLISMMELQTIDGFTSEVIEQISPYVMVDEAVARRVFRMRDIFERGNSQYFLRYHRLFEEQRGFSPIEPEELEANPNARYLGSPYRLYSRYRFTYYNNISIGVTAEKDPGEEFFRGSQPYGFDFYSAHFYMRDVGSIKSLALGDYQVQFGQGLTLWSGLAFGKSSEAVNVKKNGLGLRPYTSVDENNFMRGAGTTLRLGELEFTAFYSSKYRDANVLEVDTISQEALVITSLQQTGLHRTPRELENKNSVQETFMGSNLTWRRSNFHVGVTGYYMELGAEFRRNLSFYNQFDLNQRTNWATGLDYNYIYRNFNIFGEIATSESGGYAILNGVMMSLDPRLSMSIVHRKFSPDYQSLLSVAFSENTRVNNENGLYIGINSRLSRQWSINAYADHFSFPWMKFRTYTPSMGYDYLAQVNYRPERRIEMYARYRIKNKPLNSPEIGTIRFLDDVVRQNIRLHISYPVSPSFTLKNRAEWVDFRHGSNKQQGFLIYQDVSYRNFASPWAITARYAIFDTDGFDARIYAYENDVLYAFSFPFYSDKGHRAYIVARYRVNRNIDLQARIAQTIYTNRHEIGSGLDLIESNSRTEIKAQMRVRF
ncbi:MAG: helix-hairpin-helix domain-containing protein [Bacteroidetes bacterium]|nr:MAG: helix-hairpin-helix domain-containing protein [Bacteroidota bacterium]